MRLISCLLVGLAIALSIAGYADKASISIQADKPGIRTSPMLYGIFFEEINHAGDGGLYAELIRNRSFEDADTPEGWSTLDGGKITLETSNPLNSGTPHSLKVEGGAAATGFWGIGVKKGEAYVLGFFARAESTAHMRIALEADGKEVARASDVNVFGGDRWMRIAVPMLARKSAAKARLTFRTDKPVSLDVVSLMPRYWKHSPVRRDLAEKLAALHPAFVRFPGGCYCEGEVLKDAFRWKDSLGDISRRPGHWNLWGYRSSDGLGFHEYLQLCEDLKSEPLFVINVGMSHREVVPLDQLDPWVQDALDALEYANGPVTSKWGEMRARAGHPKSFNLRYMEIGNENGWGNTLPAYEERYARFNDAIRAKWPNVKLVANVPIRNRPMDIVDDHYYSSPEFFATNADKYAGHDRKGPKIYVGEFAVTQGCGQGNLRAALGESAFMCGLERNSDVVAMCSYAPLFVNVNDRKWNPDAIVYDSATSYGTPSYWAQQLFSSNRADVILPATVKSESKAVVAQGGVGLGTWRTQAEYGRVRVEGKGIDSNDDFTGGWDTWKPNRGDWKVVDGVYRQTAEIENATSTIGIRPWQDYTIKCRARKLAGREGFLIMFRVRDQDNWYWWNIGGWNNTEHALEKHDGFASVRVGQGVRGRVETGRWYDIEIKLEGPRIRCYLDGKLIHDAIDTPPQSLHAVAGIDEKTGELVLKVVNMADSPQETALDISGISEGASAARLTVLTSGSGGDENSLTNPMKIAPRTSKVRAEWRHCSYTFPPHSLSILRIAP